MATVSLYAELALRRRVSMSAIGSDIVISSSQPFSLRSKRRDETRRRPSWFEVNTWVQSPTGFRDAGELAGMRHLPEADAAQTEYAIDGARTTAPRAAGVAAHLELRRTRLLGD